MLTPLPSTATTRGVRVSCNPRSTPVAASITSSGVNPRQASRRYVDANAATDGPTPNAPTSGPVSATPRTVPTRPDPHGQQTPSMPWPALPVVPGAVRRATLTVVPSARKMHSPTTVSSTAAAIPCPASSGVPRWPTIAASASRNSGSATSARNAGTASRRISRSWVRHPQLAQVRISWRLCT